MEFNKMMKESVESAATEDEAADFKRASTLKARCDDCVKLEDFEIDC